MLHPINHINWVNTSTHTPGRASIYDFVCKYAHLSTLKTDPRFTYFDFSKEPIYIHDSIGWSKINAIVKATPTGDEEWFRVHIRKHDYVIVSSTQIFPVYDMSTLHVGFHGVETYDIHPTRVDQLTQGCVLRTRELGENEFVNIERIESFKPEDQYIASYFIKTDSKFFNVNGIQMISQDDLFPTGIDDLKC